MKNSVVIFFKPKQLLKLLLVLACLITLFSVVRDNIKPPEVSPLPHSVPPEIERGEFLSWEEVDQIFRRYTNATVIDVDTGLSFQVQRRGGTYHADVQPLTAQDTAIMKIIYNGTWSWQRKAVVVQIGNRRIAASMNGMPHGSGAIRGNNFNGHFCIHFRDSKVHQSGKENLAHQMMIWKAAGKFQQMITAMGPEEVIEVLINALDQRDINLALKTLHQPGEKQRSDLNAILQQIDRIKVQRIRSEGGNPETFWVYLTLRYQGSHKDMEKKIELQAVDQGEKGWRIISDGLQEILNRQALVEIFDVRIFDDGDRCD
ncbi:hypothetical protein [Desulforamulus ferrireducens]|uniref:Uncharacterized protein n=1 Tax=Desulforamulus ferrireducens TaxID=1833852 RepID=A0A1S6ITV1_9FIRM|nr:hypothetical protein [Desulforamulus ferrireducens]AQS58208.1 hypothetical protein B0537_03310 [Desulforamulus ferrireducens]